MRRPGAGRGTRGVDEDDASRRARRSRSRRARFSCISRRLVAREPRVDRVLASIHPSIGRSVTTCRRFVDDVVIGVDPLVARFDSFVRLRDSRSRRRLAGAMGATVTAGSSIAVRGERRRRWGSGSRAPAAAARLRTPRPGRRGGARAGRGRVGRGSARTTIARARETSRDGGSSYARSRRRGDGDDGDEDDGRRRRRRRRRRRVRVACRTATGAALATVLARDGWDAFERASTETLCALVEGGFDGGERVRARGVR